MNGLQQPLLQALPPCQHHLPQTVLQHSCTTSPLHQSRIVLISCEHALESLHLYKAHALHRVLKLVTSNTHANAHDCLTEPP